MPIVQDPAFDSALAFFTEGYDFIGRRCRHLGTDLFRTRIATVPFVCMMGEEAARRFYDGESFTRKGALPPTTLRLLQDKHSVMSLDGEAHRRRKHLFLSMLSAPSIARFGETFELQWQDAFPAWRARRVVVLHKAMAELLCAAALAWAGIPAGAEDARLRAEETMAMIDGAGALGPRLWRGLALRRRGEAWAAGVIDSVRNGGTDLDPDLPAAQIARFRDADGALLTRAAAAEELLNLIRPAVAVARFITFAAVALHEHGDIGAWLARGGAAETEAFAQEVRRFYPFFPAVGGRVRQAFAWRGHEFGLGDRVLLGLYATNHDPRLWRDPSRFDPVRFLDRPPAPFAFIPQGAGDVARDHRCPGEALTVEIIHRATRLLQRTPHRVPEQNLAIPHNRFPTLPKSGFIVAFR